MYDVEFWKRVERDRQLGMTVTKVCEKYNIIPYTLRQARFKGILNDKRNLTKAEANEKRNQISLMSKTNLSQVHTKCNGSLRQILNELNMSHSTTNRECVKNALIKIGCSIKHHRPFGTLSYTIPRFKEACKQASTFTELTHLLGMSIHTDNNRTFKKLITEHGIDTSHWGHKNKQRNHTYDEIFCKNSKASRTNLRNKVLQYGVLDLISCSKCSTSEWQGEPLVIQVDHTNGDSTDNRVSNLRGLCPNCHSQTITFGGKFRQKRS